MKHIPQSTITRNRNLILDRWMGAGLDLFTGTMASSSPAGETLAGAMGLVLDDFDGRKGDCSEGIGGIARFLAIQQLPPSRSLTLFGALEKIIGELLNDDAERQAVRGRVQQLLLEAFDRFMESREILYRMKVEESQRKMHMLLRRAVS